MTIKALEHWVAILTILGAVLFPFVGWASGESTLRLSIVMAVVALVTNTASFLNQSLSAAKERADKRKKVG